MPVLSPRRCTAVEAALAGAQQEAVWAFEAWRQNALASQREQQVSSGAQRMATLEGLARSREVPRQRELAAAVVRIKTLQADALRRAEELEGRETRLQVRAHAIRFGQDVLSRSEQDVQEMLGRVCIACWMTEVMAHRRVGQASAGW